MAHNKNLCAYLLKFPNAETPETFQVQKTRAEKMRNLTHKESMDQRKANIAKKMNTDQILMYSANGGNGSMYERS